MDLTNQQKTRYYSISNKPNPYLVLANKTKIPLLFYIFLTPLIPSRFNLVLIIFIDYCLNHKIYIILFICVENEDVPAFQV